MKAGAWVATFSQHLDAMQTNHPNSQVITHTSERGAHTTREKGKKTFFFTTQDKLE